MTDKRLSGRYEIIKRVGGGGMAIVYEGHDLLLDRTVAIKVLRSQYGTDEEFIRRFRREAQSAARLTHPNVVSIYDVGQDEDTHYIVMEYVEGETLKDLIKRESPLEIHRAVNIAIQIAEALEHAHQNHIIHRDIKPHNILISTQGRVKVTDFGIARAVTSATITHTGSVIGSVHYFSPEQAKGGITGEKSDIYSLGVVLYEMVTGHLPFSGDSPISVALKHLQEDFQDPREINPAIPQSLENIILKALCKDPDQRYSSAREMVKDLMTCLREDRLNEAKFFPKPPDEGEDPTIIIPAIRDRSSIKGKFKEVEPEEEIVEEDWEEPETNRKKWLKPTIWVGVLLLLFALGYYVTNQIQSLFEVPEVEVPLVENMPFEDAEELLTEKGFKVDLTEEFNSDVEKGYVIRQSPDEGKIMKAGTTVSLFVSKGKQTISMPDVTNQTQRDAEGILLSNYTFKEVKVEEEYNEDVPAGSVIRQEPEPDTEVVAEETTVTLFVSKGAETFPMPSLIGKTEAEADNIAVKNDLILEKIYVESYFEEGIVSSQWPIRPGEQVSKGQKIRVEISSKLKDDALPYIDEVMVLTDPDTNTDVVILISDARYTNFEIVNETIRNSKPYEIELVLSPNHDATISVYKNGVLHLTRSIRYAEVAGGD